MADEPEGPAKARPPQDATGSVGKIAVDADDAFAGAEPWDPIETKIVAGSFIAAAIALVVFAVLIHIYILP